MTKNPPPRRPSALLLALLLAFTGCAAPAPSLAPGAGTAWVGTWGTAPQLTEPANLPPPPGLAGSTLRQRVRVSIGGERLRVRVSNAFGDGPLVLEAAALALSAGADTIVPQTGRALTFDGRPSITLAAGEAAVSDPVAFPLRAMADVAVTLRFGAAPAAVTGHPGSRTTSYLQAGDHLAAGTMPDAARTDHWYVLTGIEVVADDSPGAVVVLGNSITDGRGSGTNRNNRWPDELSRRLRGDERTDGVAVLNMGIGGNCVLRACLGPAAVDRFERDVLDQPGVRWLVILEGINDVGQAEGAEGARSVARALTEAYGAMIDRARARGIRVYGATLLPFGASFYDTPDREAARQAVNAWIRTSGRFDAVIDLDAAMRDPANPTRLRPEADTGDHLHPNEAGHRMIAEAIDLALFR